MTKLLLEALEAVGKLSPEQQDAIAEAILALADDRVPPQDIPAADLASVLRGLDDVRHGRFASDQEVEIAYRQFNS